MGFVRIKFESFAVQHMACKVRNRALHNFSFEAEAGLPTFVTGFPRTTYAQT